MHDRLSEDFYEVHEPHDPIVSRVLQRIQERSRKGMETYGVTMMRDDISHLAWLRHLQEELLDAAVYLERVIHDLSSSST